MKKAVPFLLLIILFAAAIWYSLTSGPDPVHELPPPALTLEPAVQEPPLHPGSGMMTDAEPAPEPEPLPALHESDAGITAAVAGLAGEDVPAQYLVKDQVISRMVATIDSLTSRQVPLAVNPVKPASGKLVVSQEGDRISMSADNYARYGGYVVLLKGLDNDALLKLYFRHYPLFQQAWEENGGAGSFHDRLLEVIDHLLATPEVEGDIYLAKPEAVYLFEDSELEALTAGQKILLRMGPDNAAVVKAKLQEIKNLLLEN
jgi:hypothetical protein